MDTTKSTSKPAPDQPTDIPASTQEIGGRGGPDPARYGDWEVGGKCVDF